MLFDPHKPDDVLVSPLVGSTFITGCRQRDDLLFPHKLQLLVESLSILLLGRQQQLAEPYAPGTGLTIWKHNSSGNAELRLDVHLKGHVFIQYWCVYAPEPK